MLNGRSTGFLASVAEAARNSQPTRPRGNPMLDNLTAQGRDRGLSAMHAAPRCRSKRRDGLCCRAPALRGATRCLKHGGRVEVPSHPHNVKRFLNGQLGPLQPEGDPDVSDQAFWEALSPRLQREVLSVLPRQVWSNPTQLFLAARIWMDVRDRGYPAVRRFVEQFTRA